MQVQGRAVAECVKGIVSKGLRAAGYRSSHAGCNFERQELREMAQLASGELSAPQRHYYRQVTVPSGVLAGGSLAIIRAVRACRAGVPCGPL